MATFPVLLTLNILLLLVFTINLLIWILFMVLLSPFVDAVVLLSITDAIDFTFFTEINLPPWAFSLWGLVYLWQLASIIYSFILTFKFRRLGPPVILTPTFLGVLLLSLIIQTSLNIAAIFVLELAFALFVVLAVTLFVSLGLTHNALFKNRFALAQQNRQLDDILVRVVIHNGVALYATWVATLALINMTVLITVRSNPPIDQQVASTIVIVFFYVFTVVYVVLDLTVFDRLSRYTITPYLVRIWWAAAIVSNRVAFMNGNIFAVALLLGIALASLLDKIALVIFRSKTDPIFPDLKRPKESHDSPIEVNEI